MRTPHYPQTASELEYLAGHPAIAPRLREMRPSLYDHTITTSSLALDMAHYFSKSHDERRDIGIGALVHDFGKLKHQELYEKSGNFTQEEWDLARTHPEEGALMIIQDFGSRDKVLRMVLMHHVPNVNNSYPPTSFERRQRPTLVEEEKRQQDRRDEYRFPEEVQLLALADKYEALTSPFRANYRTPLRPREALEELPSIVRVNEKFYDALTTVIARELAENKLRAA